MIPATVVATPVAPVVHAPREYMAVVYGLIVVVAGFVAILIALWLIVINANTSNTSSNAKGLSDPAAFMGMVAIAIAGLGGAFFGVALGLQGVVNANKERRPRRRTRTPSRCAPSATLPTSSPRSPRRSSSSVGASPSRRAIAPPHHRRQVRPVRGLAFRCPAPPPLPSSRGDQGKEMVEMGESRTPRPETFAGDHYERVR